MLSSAWLAVRCVESSAFAVVSAAFSANVELNMESPVSWVATEMSQQPSG
jgi:hypothetical protein